MKIVLISEFKRGKDRFKRKNKATLKGHTTKGAILGSKIGLVGGVIGAGMMLKDRKMYNQSLKKVATLSGIGAAGLTIETTIAGGVIGSSVYGSKKLLNKDK